MGKTKKKCCRSTPLRCNDCPVVALRLARLKRSGVKGRALKKAVLAARAA